MWWIGSRGLILVRHFKQWLLYLAVVCTSFLLVLGIARPPGGCPERSERCEPRGCSSCPAVTNRSRESRSARLRVLQSLALSAARPSAHRAGTYPWRPPPPGAGPAAGFFDSGYPSAAPSAWLCPKACGVGRVRARPSSLAGTVPGFESPWRCLLYAASQSGASGSRAATLAATSLIKKSGYAPHAAAPEESTAGPPVLRRSPAAGLLTVSPRHRDVEDQRNLAEFRVQVGSCFRQRCDLATAAKTQPERPGGSSVSEPLASSSAMFPLPAVRDLRRLWHRPNQSPCSQSGTTRRRRRASG